MSDMKKPILFTTSEYEYDNFSWSESTNLNSFGISLNNFMFKFLSQSLNIAVNHCFWKVNTGKHETKLYTIGTRKALLVLISRHNSKKIIEVRYRLCPVPSVRVK